MIIASELKHTEVVLKDSVVHVYVHAQFNWF